MISTNTDALRRYKPEQGEMIYSLVNLDNGKRYVGRTSDPQARIKAHLRSIKKHKHPNPLINKDSDCRFGYEILEDNVHSICGRRETFYMLVLQTYDKQHGYNVNDKQAKTINHLLVRELCREYISLNNNK